MLFTDGNFIPPNLLDQLDGEFSRVMAAETALTPSFTSSSFIAKAVNSSGSEFISRIQGFSGYLCGVGVNANHQAAVLNILSTAINRPRALLNQIPVTEPNPTRLAMLIWVQYYVLYEFYNTMSNRKVLDRYSKKADRYEKEKKRAWENLKGNGFPIVISPLSCPGAVLEYNAGTFGASNVTAVAGGASASPVTYDVAITWCNLPLRVSNTNPNNGESAGSIIVTQLVPDANVLQVNTTGLNPPDGTVSQAIGSAQGISFPLAATHWNVYAGLTGTTLYLQNNAPIPIATTTYTFTAAPAASGFPLSAGQSANYDFSFMNILWRA